jgi:hypothetical protein
MATHLYSSSTAIESVASQLRSTCSQYGAACAAVHLPGKLNVYTDRPSRAGEKLFEQAQMSSQLVAWAAAILRLKASSGRVGLRSPVRQWHLWSIVLPRPHTRLEEVSTAVKEATALKGHPILLVMPVAASSDNRGKEFKSNCSWLKRVPANIPLFERDVSACDPLWRSKLTVPFHSRDSWALWRVNTV